MLAGEVKRPAFELSGVPFMVPSKVSNKPLRPIWWRSLLPSWVYFWIMPPGELAIQTLLSGSKWQVCSRNWTISQARDTALDEIGIAPEMNHLAGRVEFDHERREMPGIEFAIQDVLTIEKEHVVLRIDAVTAETARDPQVREGLREGDIDLVARRDALRPGRSDIPR